MKSLILYHNPKCSKSRQALALIRDNGIEPEIVEYLKTPLTLTALKQLIKKLKVTPTELVRMKEFKAQIPNSAALIEDDAALLKILSEHPALMERPVVVAGDYAVIARPPEKLLELL
jgi:arsenate reductase (glutaredoxin)